MPEVDWGEEFSARRGVYTSLEQKIEALLKDLLEADRIDVIQVETRTKSVQSFVEKIERKRLTGDPFESVTDLVGVRVITYYQDDIARVGDLIEREFAVDADNSPGASDANEPVDHFGYRSAHYVAAVGSSRSKFAEWKRFSGLKVEFQVRTVLQHAWAAVSHKVDYKSVESAPPQIRRRLYRLSALFELADEQFTVLRDESERTQAAYETDVQRGNLEIPLDTESLIAYWNERDRDVQFAEVLNNEGLNVVARAGNFKQDRIQRDRSDLIEFAKRYGMNTIAEFDRFLRRGDVTRAASLLARKTGTIGRRPQTIDNAVTQLLVVIFDRSDNPGVPPYRADFAQGLAAARDEFARS